MRKKNLFSDFDEIQQGGIVWVESHLYKISAYSDHLEGSYVSSKQSSKIFMQEHVMT